MKTHYKQLAIVPLIAALSLSLAVLPSAAQTSAPRQGAVSLAGSNQAMQMVPANAMLSRALDAGKEQVGSTFTAKVRDKVTLADGTVLNKGAILTGNITTDDMQVNGASKLVLCFDQARLKDGRTLPIKATIVSVFKPGSTNIGNEEGERDNVPNSWKDHTLTVHQINVLPGVDLHSKIASSNSGVFVSSSKDHMTLPAQTELQLAIAPAGESADSGGAH